MQAVHQSDAAVVRPDIFRSLMKIVPAPRKPTPETTDVVIRPMLTPMEALPSATTSATVWLSISDTSAAPTHTSTCVRMPAGRFLISRSMPITAPMTIARPIRISTAAIVSGCPNAVSRSKKARIPIPSALCKIRVKFR